MGSLRRSMSRSSLRYRTATFPRSPAKFSSMVNIRSSLKLHRRSKTQGDTEAGQGDTLPRTPVPITTNIEEEEEEEAKVVVVVTKIIFFKFCRQTQSCRNFGKCQFCLK